MNVTRQILHSWARVHPVSAPEARSLDEREWSRLCDVARREGVAGLVFRAVTTADAGLDVPRYARERLRRAAIDQAAAHAWEQAVLAEVLHAFRAAGVESILLRGHALVDDLYLGDGSLRPQVDHDILVSAGRARDAARSLEAIGFERAGAGLFRRDRSLVDLHVDPYDRLRVPSRGTILKGDAGAVFSRAVPATLHGEPLLSLSPADRLLILSAHTVKHSFDRLIRLVDIAECWRAGLALHPHPMDEPDRSGAPHGCSTRARSAGPGGRVKPVLGPQRPPNPSPGSRTLGSATAAAAPLDIAALREQASGEGSSDALFYSLAAARIRLGAAVRDDLLESIRPGPRSILGTPIVDRLFRGYLDGGSCPLFAEWLLLAQLSGPARRARALREMIWPEAGGLAGPGPTEARGPSPPAATARAIAGFTARTVGLAADAIRSLARAAAPRSRLNGQAGNDACP